MSVVVRFAPSPTGYLHIGGVRTALFNWLFARHHQGRFLLRIEDTDRARSTDDAIRAITQGLQWMGLQADEPPVFQFARKDYHKAAAERLLEEGKAYRCYCTPEELEAMREKAKVEGKRQFYDRRWRDKSPGPSETGKPFVIRFKAPLEGSTVVEDAVQGQVTVDNSQLDDMILLRSDSTPTYMLSVVVDDIDMGITHIIRGDDHLNNAARHQNLFEALGAKVPVMAHIPLIHGPDGAKLSKRHGALGIEAYKEMGYLPQTLRNYLLRLGWSHGDEEIISDADAIKWFDLDGIGKAPSRMDFDKLASVNAHYIKEMSDKAVVDYLMTSIEADQNGLEDRLMIIAGELKPRAKTLHDLTSQARFMVASRPMTMESKAAKLLSNAPERLMSSLLENLKLVEDWQAEKLEKVARDLAKSLDLGFGKVAQPLRAALTGSAVSPGLFIIMEALGREECLARIGDQLEN